MSDDVSRDAYYAYGVDLIRTAGLLLRTTPSVIYRASILLQRFEASVDLHFRARYINADAMPAYRRSLEEKLARAQRLALQSTPSPLSSPHLTDATIDDDVATVLAKGAEYLIPNHAQHEMRTGLVPLVDLRAPLDYCLHHLIDQEDILYLSAACLLIATKMEDPAVRIRAVVNTFMRLSERRAGVVVNAQQKPSSGRYEDFKACIVDAEETVLHQLGFQTFVESPYTYVLMYLNLLVETAEPAAHDVQTTSPTAPAPPTASRVPSRPSPALVQWMVRAVQLVNDLPRCRRLFEVPSDVLALYAIQQTCPSDLTLPPSWTTVFGVSEMSLSEVADVYSTYLRDGMGSRRAATALSDVRARHAVAPYRTVSESLGYENTIKQVKDLLRGATRGGEVRDQATTTATSGTAATELVPSISATQLSIEELRDLIGAAPPTTTGHSTGSRRDRSDALGGNNATKWHRSEGRRDGTG